eukprot:gnl/TRDRNA2_/TRDRNA2_162741_c3_seq11.p1 gnl/TRDRNA2_/TRDRNA2_162741_c3~~gnl/TRDRNA2_/TRDRNA2_162741_c3_seq11.p1  ORF type:complete len:350 (-),score=18.59 gnl/TRDRNA2_/TRDRNA2_162741_c3_seq11:149-1198(-)
MAALSPVSRRARTGSCRIRNSACPSHGCNTFALICACWSNAATIAVSLKDHELPSTAWQSCIGEGWAGHHDEASLLQIHAPRRADLATLNDSAVNGPSSQNSTAPVVAIEVGTKSYDDVAGEEESDPWGECKFGCIAVDRMGGPASAQTPNAIPALATSMCQMYNNWRVGIAAWFRFYKVIKCGSLSAVVQGLFPNRKVQCVCQSDTNIVDSVVAPMRKGEAGPDPRLIDPLLPKPAKESLQSHFGGSFDQASASEQPVSANSYGSSISSAPGIGHWPMSMQSEARTSPAASRPAPPTSRPAPQMSRPSFDDPLSSASDPIAARSTPYSGSTSGSAFSRPWQISSPGTN